MSKDVENKILRQALIDAKRMFLLILVEPRNEPQTALEFKLFWERDKRDALNAIRDLDLVFKELEKNK